MQPTVVPQKRVTILHPVPFPTERGTRKVGRVEYETPSGRRIFAFPTNLDRLFRASKAPDHLRRLGDGVALDAGLVRTLVDLAVDDVELPLDRPGMLLRGPLVLWLRARRDGRLLDLGWGQQVHVALSSLDGGEAVARLLAAPRPSVMSLIGGDDA